MRKPWHQILYGLRQLLDYLNEYAEQDQPAHGVIFLPRPPTQLAWVRKCESVDVELSWPGKWPAG